MGPKWKAYRDAVARRSEADDWLAHIGKRGRGSDILNLSSVHASLKLVIAGQYQEGGKNYWDSPESFNKAMLTIIHREFAALSSCALDELKRVEKRALVEAKAEVEGALQAIKEAEAQ